MLKIMFKEEKLMHILMVGSIVAGCIGTPCQSNKSKNMHKVMAIRSLTYTKLKQKEDAQSSILGF